MKTILLFIFLLNFTMAKELAKITFPQKIHNQTFTLLFDEKKTTYQVLFIDEKNIQKSKFLSAQEAALLKAEITRLQWKSNYQNSKKSSPCTPYVIIKTENEKSQICQENGQASGQSFSLLNELNKKFQ